MAISFYRREIKRLMDECVHTFKPLTEDEIKDEFFSVRAFCIGGCLQDFGFRCKESPDQVCHYYSLNERVELINKESVPVPEGHNSCNEVYEICIFCKNPRKRK